MQWHRSLGEQLPVIFQNCTLGKTLEVSADLGNHCGDFFGVSHRRLSSIIRRDSPHPPISSFRRGSGSLKSAIAYATSAPDFSGSTRSAGLFPENYCPPQNQIPLRHQTRARRGGPDRLQTKVVVHVTDSRIYVHQYLHWRWQSACTHHTGLPFNKDWSMPASGGSK
jgi:hypothetical protein